jgi:hypothetical protein
VTILGALIVFVTFITKDAIRENLKDLNSSLAEADNLFTLQEDIGLVQLHLVKVEENIIEIAAKQSASDSKRAATRDYAVEIRNTLSRMKDRDAALQDEFDRISRLVGRMPVSKSAAVRGSFAKMQEEISIFHREAEDKEKEVSEGAQDADALDEARAGLVFLLAGEVPIIRMGSQVLDLARKEERDIEAAYQRYTRLAFVLYALGWSLSLYGTLSGLPVSGGGE